MPDPAAAAKGNSLRADQVLAVKPGAPVSIKINLPGATAEEVQKVTKVLIDEVKRVGMVLTPNAPLVIECSIADAGEGWLHVSLSHPDRSTFGLGLALADEPVLERNGLTHLRLRVGPDEPAISASDVSGDLSARSYFTRPGAA